MSVLDATDTITDQDSQTFVHTLRNALRGIHQKLGEAISRDLNIEPRDMGLLYALKQGLRYPSEVREYAKQTGPAVSQMIDRCIQAGLVTREFDPQDSRRTIVTLTAHGIEALDCTQQASLDWLRGSGVSAQDLRICTQVLAQLSQEVSI